MPMRAWFVIGRAALAVLLMFGFYILALGMRRRAVRVPVFHRLSSISRNLYRERWTTESRSYAALISTFLRFQKSTRSLTI